MCHFIILCVSTRSSLIERRAIRCQYSSPFHSRLFILGRKQHLPFTTNLAHTSISCQISPTLADLLAAAAHNWRHSSQFGSLNRLMRLIGARPSGPPTSPISNQYVYRILLSFQRPCLSLCLFVSVYFRSIFDFIWSLAPPPDA